MQARHLIFPLILFAHLATAAPRPLISLTDPVGDDHGDGTLVYPLRSDFEPGDLDLVRLSLSQDDDGYWFEAEFKNPIRTPDLATGGVGPESLAEFARKGFYTFNIDIYIDGDRKPGVGNQFTLPGRGGARIDPAYAWEKAVVLTPRPEFMRAKLLDVLEKQFPDRPVGEAEVSMDQAFYFSSRIKVRGKTVAFFVPARFLAGINPMDMAITALVTGAVTSNPAGISLFPTQKTPLEELDLGAMQPKAGRPKDTFGHTGRSKPLPVVDLLHGQPDQQATLLKTALKSASWGAHAGQDAAPVAAPAAVTQSAAAPTPAAPATTEGSLWSRSWGAVKGLFSEEPARPAPVAPAQAAPIQALMDPTKPAPAPSVAPEASPVQPQSFSQRLRTLQQLLDDKLITEEEYKQQRARILNEL
ncbi:MAG: glucodextranase DOMON-like domain-containing protein [Pseudomonadota bacterium]